MSSASYPYKTNPSPNFFAEYSVILQVPVVDVFATLGTSTGHESVCRLSKLCSKFELLQKDQVSIPVPGYPKGKALADTGVRTAAATTPSLSGLSVTRQHFTMEERVPLIFGLLKSKVQLAGTLSWHTSPPSLGEGEEDVPLQALYETQSDGGIVVWKLRTFEEVPGDEPQTRVTERIEGWCPPLLRFIVQNETTKSHRAHMELYHTLF